MSRRLYAMLPKGGEPIEFALATDTGITLMSTGTADIESSDEIVVFVPATEVGYFHVRLPSQGTWKTTSPSRSKTPMSPSDSRSPTDRDRFTSSRQP